MHTLMIMHALKRKKYWMNKWWIIICSSIKNTPMDSILIIILLLA